jgi:predicted RNase H-like nuclease (RuvC/YqgF family)
MTFDDRQSEPEHAAQKAETERLRSMCELLPGRQYAAVRRKIKDQIRATEKMREGLELQLAEKDRMIDSLRTQLLRRQERS